MRKAQDENMSACNDTSFVKEHITDETVKGETLLFAATPVPGESFADIEADVRAFLAFVEAQKHKTNGNT